MATATDACTSPSPFCLAQTAVDAATSAVANSAADSALAGLGAAINAALVSVIASLGTLWAQLPTPDLVTFGGAGAVSAGEAPPQAGQLDTVVGWIAWGALVATILAMIILGAVTAASQRSGDASELARRYKTWALGAVVISGATSIVSFLLPVVPQAGTGTVSFITNATWWLAGSIAVITTIIAGAKTAVQQRAAPAMQQLQSLIVLIVVSLAGVALVGALSQVADSFSSWILSTSMTCDPAGGGDCFASNMALVLPNLLVPGQTGLASILLVLLGTVAVLVSLGQIALMVVRIAMLVLLAGLLPLSAAGASTEIGRTWFRRNVVWLAAFLLYKPAAAMIYAVAFQLAGSDVAGFDDTGLVAVMAGLALMIVAIVALPVMLRFAAPMTSAVAGGSGGGAGLAAAVALPTGAISLGRAAMQSSNGGAGAAGAAGSSGPSGSGGTAGAPGSGSGGGPPGSPSGGGGNPFAPPAPRSGGAGGSGAGAGAPAGGGATVGGAGGAGAATAGGAGTGAAGGAAGAGAAGGAGAGTAAGAAGGPVGMAVGAGLGQAASAATGAVRGVADGARDAAEGSSGGSEPTGSTGAPAAPTSRWNTSTPGLSGPSGSTGSAAGADRTDEGDLPSGSR